MTFWVVSDKLCQGLICIFQKLIGRGAPARRGGSTRPDERKFTLTEISLQIFHGQAF